MKDDCFTTLCWFLPYINMNQPQVHTCPLPAESPSPLPPHPTPLGCYRAPVWAPRVTQQIPTDCLFHIWWWRMFPRSPPRPPRPLSIRPALSPSAPPYPPDCVHTSVLCVCISIAACTQVHQDHPSRFVMCALKHDICFSLFDFTLYNNASRFIHLISTDSNAFLFYGWVIFHCIYGPQLLYLFIWWWTSRLLLCPSLWLLLIETWKQTQKL